MTERLTLIIPCAGEDCAYLDAHLPPSPYRVLIIRNRPYGEAIKLGLTLATTPYVATMDADGQHELQDIPPLYRAFLARRAAMVIGQRTHRDPGLRALSSSLLNLAASILAGRHVPDLGSGIRVFRRRIALDYYARLPNGFDFNTALTMAFLRGGHRVDWVRTHVRPRQVGRSHVTLADGVKALRSLR